MTSKPAHGVRLSARQLVRAGMIGSMVTGAAMLAHSVHGHVPSLGLVVVTLAVTSLLLLSACQRCLRMRTAFAAMLVGQLALHAWFAWFNLPTLGDPVSASLHAHHSTFDVELPTRDFSALLPSPTMTLAHVIAAALLAVVLAWGDRVFDQAVGLLSTWWARIDCPAGILPRSRFAVVWNHQVRPDESHITTFVKWRGPPALAAV